MIFEKPEHKWNEDGRIMWKIIGIVIPLTAIAIILVNHFL